MRLAALGLCRALAVRLSMITSSRAIATDDGGCASTGGTLPVESPDSIATEDVTGVALFEPVFFMVDWLLFANTSAVLIAALSPATRSLGDVAGD